MLVKAVKVFVVFVSIVDVVVVVKSTNGFVGVVITIGGGTNPCCLVAFVDPGGLNGGSANRLCGKIGCGDASSLFLIDSKSDSSSSDGDLK